jgi:hypothetical protein
MRPQPVSSSDGIRAELKGDQLQLSWEGIARQQVQVSFGLQGTSPVIQEMSVRKMGGAKVILGQDLRPEFHVTTGRRRISQQQLEPLTKLGLDRDTEFLEREKWKVFWDAPLVVPGASGTNPGLPRSPDEIRRAAATYDSRDCRVKSDGARIEVSFSGLSLGIFSGRLQFTAYRGTNLLRQEAIAKTDESSVAYHYRAGLRGFQIDRAKRVVWRDGARGWQGLADRQTPTQGSASAQPAGDCRERWRLDGGASPPHKFFFGRNQLNLGYVWYRKDDDQSLRRRSPGGRRRDVPPLVCLVTFGNGARQARSFAQGNFALTTPRQTWQRMAVYYYLSPDASVATQEQVLAFTHDDRYAPVPGFQVAVSHFHTAFHEQVLDAGSLDFQPPWIPTFRALGINIAMMSDFHGDGHAKDPGPLRLPEQKAYFEASRRHSDRDFLIMPGEEPNAHFGGHYTTVFPRGVFWTQVRQPGQALVENHPEYGKVYHVGSSRTSWRCESGKRLGQAHPRTKGSSGYPDATRETEYFRSDRFLGGAFQSLPLDLSSLGCVKFVAWELCTT